jgi:hypothetical protein
MNGESVSLTKAELLILKESLEKLLSIDLGKTYPDRPDWEGYHRAEAVIESLTRPYYLLDLVNRLLASEAKNEK